MKKVLTFFIVIFLTSSLQAAKTFERGTLARDAEIESILKRLLRPLFKVADLNPNAAKLYIIIDSDMNAAAGLGYRIFINSGLLIKAKSAHQVAGVLAHETGHIACGHLMRRKDAMGRASLLRMAGYALGAAVAALSGRAEPLMASVVGSDNAALGTILKYSRGQESAADQAAVRYMNKLGWPIHGFLTMMEMFMAHDLLSETHQEPYMRTHPLSRERVNFLKNMVQDSLQKQTSFPSHIEQDFILAQVKLKAYTLTPGQIFLEFSEKRQDTMALYARAIAYYRDRQISKALGLFQQLTRMMPSNAYIWEMMGQILFEEGRKAESQRAYDQALKLAPHEPLIQMACAQVLLSNNQAHTLTRAVNLMEKVIITEDDYASAWHLLAIAYGKQKKPAMASYALAKEAVCLEKFDVALKQIDRAMKGNVPATIYQKLKDLKLFVLALKDENQD